MTSIKFEHIWRMMRKYQFNISDKAHTDVVCNSCKMVMIDPCITGCGCQFCYECIKKSLPDSGNYCPGGKEECFEEYLEIDKSIVRDLKTGHSISQIDVECPHEFCSTVLQLRKMEDHIRICKRDSESCPFQTIGCPEDRLNGIKISDHLMSDVLEHSQLLIETINHWRNDVKKLHETDELKDTEISKLKFESKRNINQIKELEEKIRRNDIQTKGVIEEWKREIGDEMDKIREEMKIMKLNDITKICKVKTTILDDDGYEVGYRSTDMSQNEKDTGGGEEYRKEIQSMKNDTRTVCEDIQRMNRCLSEMNLIHDFMWTISDISSRRQQFYESTSFYKDNYKACMRIWIDGYNLHLYLCIIRGDMDNNVEWPMRHTVILGILNQDTMRTQANSRYSFETHSGNKSAYNKPSETRNEHIGGMKVSRTDIARISGLLCNDSVIVTCSLARAFPDVIN